MAIAALLALMITTLTNQCNANPKFPAILVFGDSTVDTGNNNYISTPFKGNHPPYGYNFPEGAPTGRFSDGRLVPDILASLFGLKEAVPPFLDPILSDQDVVTGVSFASAGSGYDALTTSFTRVISMSRQLDYLNEYVERLQSIVGEKEAAEILSRALVIVSAGTNDFTFNFYDFPTRRLEFTISQYQNFLQAKLQSFIKALYDVGCRKMVVSGLPPIGCLPIQMTVKSPLLRSCCQRENEEAVSYNDKLEKVVRQMETDLAGCRILYADVYNPMMDMINNPLKYEFTETKRGCCGTGLLEAGPLCTPLAGVCAEPSRYLFWDSIHPTESTYQILAHKLAQSLTTNMSFHSIKQ
ncbi:GDSL esterase/lipase At2g31550-like isoform X2 [Salvia hispanica]|uniref:GDSL esterase/lipase At2g31550-like isoform X2 n=1 Tax=Salvia hispanica TaxID=49212 RepID=UPI0020091622|nr:GDSL esterase/lipase At2g31550-like isoform X2 [Salvia hispanica]